MHDASTPPMMTTLNELPTDKREKIEEISDLFYIVVYKIKIIFEFDNTKSRGR
jgi:hypothetical protein